MDTRKRICEINRIETDFMPDFNAKNDLPTMVRQREGPIIFNKTKTILPKSETEINRFYLFFCRRISYLANYIYKYFFQLRNRF